MKVLGILVSSLMVAGCAFSVYHDRAMTNPRYHEGMLFDPKTTGRDGNNPGEAVTGILASALSLVHSPNFYAKSTIGGRCLYAVPDSLGFDLPCTQVTVVLQDDRHREIARQQAGDGRFVFLVEPEQSYFLAVASPSYRMEHGTLGPVSMGDDVVIRLTRRTSE